MTTDEPGPKEIIYDERIFPLMTQIIDLCKDANISVFANFELDDRVDDDGSPYRRSCQTCLPQPGDEKQGAAFMRIARPTQHLGSIMIFSIDPPNREPEPDDAEA